jgi:hypothetical protein
MLKDTSAVAAVVYGAALPVVMGTAALGIDVGSWYTTRASLQSMADTVASSGALEIFYNANYTTAQAWDDLAVNQIDTSDVTSLTVNTPPIAGAYVGKINAVEVLVSTTSAVYFASFFLTDPVTVSVRAVANSFTLDEACMVGLDRAAPMTISTAGAAVVNMDCGIAANSNHANAIQADGNVDVTVPTVISAGGVIDNTNSGIHAGDIVTNARPIEDPYDDVTVPFYGGCDQNDLTVTTTTTLSPGVYCGGLAIEGSADVTLQPGVYIIDAGNFSISGQAVIVGTGVTIILTGADGAAGNIAVTGGSVIDLTAPSDGDYEDILFYQDRNAAIAGHNEFSGGADASLNGTVYTPNGELYFGGTGGFNDLCTNMVSAKVSIVGDFSVIKDCTSAERRLIGRRRAALVE